MALHGVRFQAILITALIVFPLIATAQSQAVLAEMHTKPFQADVNLVLVPVQVTDAEHRPVLELTKEDFSILEDNEPQAISYFYSEDAPLSVAIVVDLSGSMGKHLDSLRQAVTQFFNYANPADEYFVVAVSDHPQLLVGPTSSTDDVERRLVAMKPTGWTALLDSVKMAVTALRSARYERRAVLIISDAGENASRTTRRQIRELVEESDIDAYAVGIFDEPLWFFRPLEQKLAQGVLTNMTDVTGGHMIPVRRIDEIAPAVAEVSHELRNRYVLGYHPTKPIHDRGWRKIKVEVKPLTDRQRLRTYYKKSYFTPDKTD